jgi:predicted metal-dependent phosphoesterase TrpH
MPEKDEPKADLHTHSVFSDGDLTPGELVQRAGEIGLSVISLADHDTIRGVGQALSAGREKGVEVIPCTELSTIFKGMDIHILGYYIDIENRNLKDWLLKFEHARARRAEKMVKNLNRQGLKIDFEDVMKEAGDGVIGRPHMAAALLRRGIVQSFDEAFYLYIGMHCPAYVRKYELKPEDAVDIIHRAGGLAVMAHPLVGRPCREDVLELTGCGLDGLEATHPKLSPADSEWIRRTAKGRGLLITGGSDYHGDSRGPGTLGENYVPVDYVQSLKDALEERRQKASGISKTFSPPPLNPLPPGEGKLD